MDREQLLKQLTIMDFMATDLHLYLNTHPGDADALRMFNDVVAQSTQARNDYEKHFGPLISYRSPDPNGWRWSDCPWPWAEDFNFKWDEKHEDTTTVHTVPDVPQIHHEEECL